MNKFFVSVWAQLNKLFNWSFNRDPIALLQLECDKSAKKLKDGKAGLEQYCGLLIGLKRKVSDNKEKEIKITNRIRVLLQNEAQNGPQINEALLQLNDIRVSIEEDSKQIDIYETNYAVSVEKFKEGAAELAKMENKVDNYDACLKMTDAFATIAELSNTFNFDTATSFKKIEHNVHKLLDLNNAKVQVSLDLAEQQNYKYLQTKEEKNLLAGDLLKEFKQKQLVEASKEENK